MSPFFSVLIPSYNRPEYLPKAIQSVLSNIFGDFELIVSDDASPKRSEIQEVIRPFLQDGRFKYVQQENNIGEARNRGYLTDNSKGKFLIILADDDLLSQFALSKLHEEIQRDDEYALYLFGYSVIDENDRIIETRRALSKVELSLDDQTVITDLLCSDFHPFWMYHPATFCFPASLREAVVPNHSVGIGDDLMFLFDVILSGKKAIVIPEVLFSYRKFGAQSGYGQLNQSVAPMANVITRRHILYTLLERQNIPQAIRTFIESRQFRRRFLYNAAVTEPLLTEDAIQSLKLTEEHLKELIHYKRFRAFRCFRYYLLLWRVGKFMRYFGIRALREAFKVFKQRKDYHFEWRVSRGLGAG